MECICMIYITLVRLTTFRELGSCLSYQLWISRIAMNRNTLKLSVQRNCAYWHPARLLNTCYSNCIVEFDIIERCEQPRHPPACHTNRILTETSIFERIPCSEIGYEITESDLSDLTPRRWPCFKMFLSLQRVRTAFFLFSLSTFCGWCGCWW